MSSQHDIATTISLHEAAVFATEAAFSGLDTVRYPLLRQRLTGELVARSVALTACLVAELSEGLSRALEARGVLVTPW